MTPLNQQALSLSFSVSPFLGLPIRSEYTELPWMFFTDEIHAWRWWLKFISRQQQSDETPMVWEMLLYMYILYSPDWHYRSTMPIFLFLYGAAFAAVHSVVRFGIGFKVHYVILCLLCIPRMYKYYIYTRDAAAKQLAKMYIATLLIGTFCWLFDHVFCKEISSWPVNPQGHALWHVFMGFNSYLANTFLMFCRAQQRGWSPRVVHVMGALPYVKIEKPKAQWNRWNDGIVVLADKKAKNIRVFLSKSTDVMDRNQTSKLFFV